MQLNQYYQTLYYRGIAASGMKALKEVLAHALFPKASLRDKKQEGFQVAETGYLRYRDAFFFGEHTKPLTPPPPTKEAAIKAYQTWAKKSQENLDMFAKKDKTSYPALFRYLQLRQAEPIYNEKNKNLSYWKLYFAVELRVLVPIRRSSRYPDIAPSAMQDDWEIPLEYLAFAQKVKTAPLEQENVVVYIGSNGIVVGLDYNHLPLETSTETELWEVVQVAEKQKLYNFVFARMANGLVALHYPVLNVEKIELRTAEGLKPNWNEADVKVPVISEMKESVTKVPASKEAVGVTNENPLSSLVYLDTGIDMLWEAIKKDQADYTRGETVDYVKRKLISDLEFKSGMRLNIDGKGYLVIENEVYNRSQSSELFRKILYSAVLGYDINTKQATQKDRIVVIMDLQGMNSHLGWDGSLQAFRMYLNFDEINRNIRCTSPDIDDSTMGFAMTFMHELGHRQGTSAQHDSKTQPFGIEGKIEKEIMNPIRIELGKQYGQRLSYLGKEINGDKVIPFTKESLTLLKNGQMPTKSVVLQTNPFKDFPYNDY